MSASRCRWVVCLLLMFVSASAGAQARVAKGLEANESAGPMRAVVERYDEDQRALNRYFGAAESEGRRERTTKFLREQGAVLEAVDFESLDRPGRIDYLLLRNTLAFEAKQLGHEREQAEEVAPLLPFAKPIVDLEDARRRGRPLDAEEAARTMTDVAAQATAARKGLEEKLSSKSKD